MAYPLPSDFTSNSPFAAWWQYARDDGSTNVCATSGSAFLAKLRASLGLGPGAWDDATQSSLVSTATSVSANSSAPAWSTLLMSLRNDAAAQTVSAASLTFGLWVAYYQPYGERLDAVAVPPGTTPPSWGSVPASGDTTLVCWNPSTDQRPELLDPTQLALAAQQSYAGIRGTPPPPSANPLGGPEGPSGWILALAGLGFVVVVGAVYVATQRGKV